jgi:hypothetical protein
MADTIQPLPDLQKAAHINSLKQYREMYDRSLKDPEVRQSSEVFENTLPSGLIDRSGVRGNPLIEWVWMPRTVVTLQAPPVQAARENAHLSAPAFHV